MTAFQIGNINVYSYGLIMAGGALIALLLMGYSGSREGLRKGAVSWFAVLTVPLAVLSARIGYCLASLDWMREQGFGFFLQFSRGGYMFYGALLGGLLSAWIASRLSGERASRIIDCASAPTALMIIIGRLAEPLVNLGYGHNIEEWFDPWMEKSMIALEDPSMLYRFPFGMQDYYGDWNFAIFIPEALTALAALIVLLCMKKRRDGARGLMLITIYSSWQVIWESMRQDEVLRWGFVRVNQLLSGVALLAVLFICWRALAPEQRRPSELVGRLAGMGGLFGIVIAMEFALEQKISFLTWMRMDVCYGVMALCCCGFMIILIPLWKKAFPVRDA